MSHETRSQLRIHPLFILYRQKLFPYKLYINLKGDTTERIPIFYFSGKMDAKRRMVDEEEESLGSFSSLSSSEATEDTASSGLSSSSSSPTSSCKGPLFEMSCLREQLPFKRGLSKYYQGKSQSFTSFSGIGCLEDLVKPERPLKRLKASKSCGEGLDSNKSPPVKSCSKRTIARKHSKGCFSTSISARRNCLLGSKPPLYPHRPGNLSDQTLWFA